LEARRSFAAARPIAAGVAIIVMASANMIWQAGLTLPCRSLTETSLRQVVVRGGTDEGLHLAPTTTLPIGVEDIAEPLPIRMGRAKQRTQRRLQRRRTPGDWTRENCKRIAGLRQSDLEAIGAQRPGKSRKPLAHQFAKFFGSRVDRHRAHRASRDFAKKA